MNEILYVDVVGGAAGDMLLAALLDAGAPRDAVENAVASVLGRRVELVTSEVRRGGLRALALDLPGRPADRERHRGPLALMASVEGASLATGVARRALAVLRRLGEAEAKVHGVGLEELELEELGEDDTLVDVVGIAAALEGLEVDLLAVSSLPLPPTSAIGRHGVPGPVTLELLQGLQVRPSAAGDELRETVTPTAAAVLATLGDPVSQIPEMTIERVGYGAGRRDPPAVANVVRVVLGTTEAAAADARRLFVLEANVDDLSPELVPDAIEGLLAAGALDAWTTSIHMKRGRPGLTISALCPPSAEAAVRRAFFESTSTLGLREHEVARPELERRSVEVDLAEGGPSVRVKIGFLDGRALSAKPEHADVVEAARKLDRSVPSVHAQAAALAHALLEEDR